MRKFLGFGGLVIAALLIGCPSVTAQSDCPPDKVCLTRDRAAYYLTLEDTVKAQEKEILALKQAVIDQKLVTVDVKIELAKTVGENTILKGQVVDCNADKEMLIKYGRVRKLGFIVF